MPDDSAVSGLPYWDQRDWQDAWDILVLGEDEWPGVWEISGAGVSRKIDIKKQAGTDGSTMTDEGYQPAQLTITGTIWTKDQWSELQRLIPKIHPRKPGGSRTPMEIYHPQSSLLGITQIYINKIGIPKKPSSGNGLLELSMSAVEWVPSPKPVKTGAGTGAAPTAAEAADEKAATIEDLKNKLAFSLMAGDANAVDYYANLINNMSYSEPTG